MPVKSKKLPNFKTDKQAEASIAKADLLRGQPMSAVFPQFASQMKRRGRPKSDDPKQIVTIRLDREVLEYFRKSGPGWQTKINATLRRAVKRSMAKNDV